MTLKTRDRVIITDFNGNHLLKGTIVNVNEFREPRQKYAIDVDGYSDDVVFLGEESLIKIQEETIND